MTRAARLLALGLALAGCASGTARPTDPGEPAPADAGAAEPSRPYARTLPAATTALTRVPEIEWPDLIEAASSGRETLLRALDRSLEWFARPSSRDLYPVSGVTHDEARASVFAFRQLVARHTRPEALAAAIRGEFDLHSSVGYDGRGTVLFTGYYTPVFEASRTRTDEFRHPLYRRPPDLVSDPVTGEVYGRRVGDRVEPYPTRAEIERSNLLAGHELFWLRDAFEAYIIQLQGSAMLRLRDGRRVAVGYAGNNGHGYVSVARQLLADGRIRENQLSSDEVRAYFRANPDQLEPYLHRNPRYVFFAEVDAERWPAGSFGFPVTPLRSIATDQRIFPPGAVALVDTRAPAREGGTRRMRRFVLGQDAGGAIRAPGRADIYYGIGAEAGDLAGRQYSEGRLFYLLLKRDRLADWMSRLGAAP